MAKPTLGDEYDLKFQHDVVRLLYKSGDFRKSLAGTLEPGHFDSTVLRWLSGTILKAETSGHIPTRSYLHTEAQRAIRSGKIKPSDQRALKKRLATIADPVANRDWVKEEVSGFLRHQMLRDALLDGADLLNEKKFDEVEALVQKAARFQITPGGLGTFPISTAKKRLDALKLTPKNGIPTGMPIDEYLTSGGVPPKKVAFVMAPTNRGKSLFLVQLGKAAIRHGETVVHYTLDDSEEDTAKRYDASFSQVEIGRLVKHRDKVESTYRKLGRLHGDALLIKHFPMRALTVGMMHAHLRQVEAMHKFWPSLVIVDYAELMSPSVHYNDVWYELLQLNEELHRFADELELPVWSASQSNRQSLSKETVDLDSISMSFPSLAPLDLVVALCQTKKERSVNHMRLALIKNKLGPAGAQVDVKVDGKTMTMRRASPIGRKAAWHV